MKIETGVLVNYCSEQWNNNEKITDLNERSILSLLRKVL